jgi:hypothetical protein
MALRANQLDITHTHRQFRILTRRDDVVNLQAAHLKLLPTLLAATAAFLVKTPFDNPQLMAVFSDYFRTIRLPGHLPAADIEVQPEETKKVILFLAGIGKKLCLSGRNWH